MKCASVLLYSTNADTYINCKRFKYILPHIKMQTTIIHGKTFKTIGRNGYEPSLFRFSLVWTRAKFATNVLVLYGSFKNDGYSLVRLLWVLFYSHL